MFAPKLDLETSFYVAGGTLWRDAPSYVQRQADQDLYDGLRQGRFCYVLTSRQMGKSSLMIRTATRLREEEAGVVVLDLTAIGQNLSAEQWYDGLLMQMAQQLNLDDELEDFWSAHPKLGPLQRWMQAIRQVILPRYPGRVVIFVDEIDAVRSLPFSTDEFFAGIREFYNRRTQDAELERLTFCSLGVATPSDLIRDTRTTPFNIGQRIELTDFSEAEAASLAQGLGREEQAGQALLKRALYWTGGHPYLTQRLCQAVAEDVSVSDAKDVDRLCEELFLSHRAQERDDNLLFVRERILRSEADLASLLSLYAQVQNHKRVADEVTNPLVGVLRLSGITRAEDGYLQVRNRIYEHVFNQAWVKANMPDAEVQRQRAAYRRGLLRAAAVAAIILAVVSGLAVYAFQSRQHAIAQQRLADEQRSRADLSAAKAQAALAAEAEQRGRTEDQQHLAEQRQAEAQEQRQQAVAQKTLAEEQRARAEQQEYIAHMNLAQQDWETANLGRMTEFLNAHVPKAGAEDLRGFEWYYLWRLAHRDLVTWRHAWTVWSIIFSPDGKRLATSSSSKTVKLLDLATGRELFPPKGHTDIITVVAFSPDGKQLASGSRDQTVRLWDATTGRELFTLKGHTGEVTSIAFSPDGKQLVSGCRDQTVKLWDTATGQELITLRDNVKVQSVAVSFDGKRLATASYDQVKLWDMATKRVITTLQGHRAASFSPDGKKLVTTSVSDDSIKLWDAATGRELLTFKGASNTVDPIAFTPDGKRMASVRRDNTIRLWDTTTGQELHILAGHTDTINSIAISPDGKTLASGSKDRTVKLWEVATGQALATLKGHARPVYSVAFSPDGKLLASGSEDQTAKLWEMPPGQELPTLKGHTSYIISVAFSPDGKKLATGSSDRTAKLWNAATGQELLTLKGHADSIYSVAFSPDGKRLATGSEDRTAKLWDTTSGQELLTLKGHPSWVRSLAFSPDGKRLATVSSDQVKLWDAATGRELLTFKDQESSIFSVAFSPDGKRLTTGSDSPTPKLWDATSGQELFTLKGHTSEIASVIFSPDGKRLATGSRDQTVKLWDATTGQELFTLRGHADQVWSVAFSPDGKRLASASEDRTVKLWDATTGREQLTLKGHTGIVFSVAFSPDGKRLATGSSDKTVKLWDAATEKEVLARSKQ